jgi:hypothetical protein
MRVAAWALSGLSFYNLVDVSIAIGQLSNFYLAGKRGRAA